MITRVFPAARIACCVLACLTLLPGTLIAQDRDQAIRELLDSTWTTKISAHAVADQLYKNLQQIAKDDPTAAYAYALVQIKQQRYLESLDALDHAIALDASNLDAQRARVWLLARTKQYSRALDGLEQFVTLRGRIEESDEVRLEQQAKFIGRMLGFFGGPVLKKLKEANVEEYQQRIMEAIPDSERTLVDTHRQQVLDQYEGILSDRATEDARALAEAEEAQKRLIRELEKQRERMEIDHQRLGGLLADLNKEARSELDNIRKREEPLLTQLPLIESRLATRQRDSIFLTNEIFRLETDASQTDDPVLRDLLLLDADRLRVRLRRTNADLVELDAEFASLNAQRARIHRQLDQTSRSYDQQIEKLESELKRIEKLLKRNAAESQRAHRPPRPKHGKSQALKVRSTAVTAYEQFPLEAQRRKVLDSLTIR